MVIVLVNLGASLFLQERGWGKFLKLHDELDDAGMPKYEYVVLWAHGVKALHTGLLNPRRFGFVQEGSF